MCYIHNVLYICEMEMTITEYCKRFFSGTTYQRIYINRLIKAGKSELLRTRYGIIHYRLLGKQYIIIVAPNFTPNNVNIDLTK